MTTYRNLVKEAVEAWPQFDGDVHVSGADLVEWFEAWRRRAKQELAAREALPAVSRASHYS
jgi:hypothetical protein